MLSGEKEKATQDPTKPLNPQVQKILDEIASLRKSSVELDAKIEKFVAAPRGETDVKPTPEPDSALPTFDVIKKHLLECPECYEKVAQEAYGIKLDAECIGCGKSVGHEAEKCPFCGGTEARSKG